MKKKFIPKTVCCNVPYEETEKGVRCSNCHAPYPCKAAPWPSDSQDKAKEMLENVQYLAMDILMLSMAAKREGNEKERDAMIELITRRTEDIEEQYSCNWH